MKKNIKILLIALVSLLALFLVACGSFDSLFFEKEPRTTYVQGQDLDFTDTVLVAMKNDKQQTVDLTDEDVTITGYDKNTLGKQTVTFSYKEVSTTLTVNVIPRIAVEGVVTDYFVGDEVNRAEGRIRVADDQGKTTAVNFNSELITTEGFDSTTAGVKTVTIKYGDYTGTYTANVYDVEKVELSKSPKKTLYNSHDTEFVVTGAYFTVTANGGALSRYVTLTADMIENFDPSLATADNITDRLPQTVKIKYLGYEFDYKIFIVYSAVSYMRDVAKSLSEVTDPKLCDDANAEKALLALERYFTLSNSDKKLVDEADAEKIALISAYYGYEKFKELADKYSDSFVLVKGESYEDEEDEKGKYYGIFNVTLESYQAATEALASLKSDDGKKIDDLADTLRSIEREFPDLTIDGDNMDEYLCTVFSDDGIDIITGLLDVMVEIYEELSVIPNDWTAEQLIDYKANIKKAVVTITDSEFNPFKASSNLEIFKMLSKWREKNDIFYIISSYYLTHEPDSFVSAIWEKVPLPGELNDLYLAISYGLRVTKNMRVGTDTTPFMYYYRQAKTISEDIKNGDDQIEKDVYEKLSFDYLIRSYFYTGENVDKIAYVYHAAGLIGNEKVEAFLEKYIDLVCRVYKEPEFSFTASDVISASEELLADFMALSPSDRYGICALLHCDYRNNVLEESIFKCIMEDDKINAYNLFTKLILNAYSTTLSDEAFLVFADLLVATEHSSLYNFRVDGDDDFIEEMDKIVASIANLSLEEQTKLKTVFNNVFVIYDELKAPKSTNISDYQSKFDELMTVINRFFKLNYDINLSDSENKSSEYALLFANYEKARKLADEILLIENEDVLYNFYYTVYTFNTVLDEDDTQKDFSGSLDLILEEMTAIHTNILLNANVTVQYKEAEDGESEDDYMTDINAFYVYDVSGISDFLAEAYDIMWAQYNGTASELDTALVLSVMNKKIDFDADAAFAFKSLNIDVLYYGAVREAFKGHLSEEAYAMLEKLIAADNAYATYVTEDIKKNLEAFENAIAEMKSSYEALADKASFEDFINSYNNIIEKYDEIKAAEEEKEPSEE